MNKIFFVAIWMFLPAVLISQELSKFGVENEEVPIGINVGDTVADLELIFLDSSITTIYELTEERPTVVLFYRGEWCPVCNKYLNNLTDSLHLIEDRANVIVVSGEKKENMKKMADEHPEYTYVQDRNETIMTSFDVVFWVTSKYQKKIKTFLRVDIAEHNDNEDARLPVPATYIVGKNGVILYKHFNYDYGVRASALEILEVLK